MTQPSSDIDALLAALRNGQAGAIDDLFQLIYRELHQIARRQIGRLNPGQTLTPTALVHEVYMRFAEMSSPNVIDRHHFNAVAACAMRRVIIERSCGQIRVPAGAGTQRDQAAAFFFWRQAWSSGSV